MASMNKVFLMGNLTRDPDMRTLPSGAAVTQFGLAVNRRYTANGEDREETCFVEIETWGRQAETVARYLRRGSPALVEGRLQFDQWEDRETGRNRNRLYVRAERVQFLSGGSQSEDGGRGDYQSSQRDNYGQPAGPGNQQQPPRRQQQQPQQQDSGPAEMPPFETLDDDLDDNIPF